MEPKLSQMILDKKLHGILDQGTGCLELFDESHIDKTFASFMYSHTETHCSFESALGVVSNTSKVVESLYAKSHKLFTS